MDHNRVGLDVHFSLHFPLHLSVMLNQLVYENAMGDSTKIFSFDPPNQSSHFRRLWHCLSMTCLLQIQDNYSQRSSCPSSIWKWFLGFIVTLPSRDQNEAKPHVAPQSFVLLLLKGRSDTCFLPLLKNLTQLLITFQDSNEWPHNGISQLPQHSWSFHHVLCTYGYPICIYIF